MKKILFISIISLFITQCQPKNQSVVMPESNTKNENVSKNNNDMHRVWKLVSFTNFDADKLKGIEATMDLTNKSRGAAYMGCNSLTFDYTISGSDKIIIKPVASTRMACIDAELEDKFSKDIISFTDFVIQNHKLFLKNSKNQEMVFVAEDWD